MAIIDALAHAAGELVRIGGRAAACGDRDADPSPAPRSARAPRRRGDSPPWARSASTIWRVDAQHRVERRHRILEDHRHRVGRAARAAPRAAGRPGRCRRSGCEPPHDPPGGIDQPHDGKSRSPTCPSRDSPTRPSTSPALHRRRTRRRPRVTTPSRVTNRAIGQVADRPGRALTRALTSLKPRIEHVAQLVAHEVDARRWSARSAMPG